MELFRWLHIAVGWLVLNVVLCDEEWMDAETTYIPPVSLATDTIADAIATSCPSATREDEEETLVADRVPDELRAYRRLTSEDYEEMDRQYNVTKELMRAAILEQMGKRSNGSILSTLAPYMPHPAGEFQLQPDPLLARITEEIILLDAYEPPSILESVEDDVAQLYFALAPKLENRRIRKARLWFHIDPPRDGNRTLDLQLFKYLDQATGGSDSANVQTDLVCNKTVEQPANTSLWVAFSVRKIIKQQVNDFFYGITFLIKASGFNVSELVGRWKTRSNSTGMPFQHVYFFMNETEVTAFGYRPFLEVIVEKRASTREKRDFKTGCGFNADGNYTRECCRYPFVVNLQGGLGFDWVITPYSYDMGRCSGSCSQDKTPPRDELEKSAKKRCIPTEFSSAPIFYYDPYDETKTLKTFFGLVVEGCSCI